MLLRSCVSPAGKFIYGVHKPHFKVTNMREADFISSLGVLQNGTEYKNTKNFPGDDVQEENGDWIYEIPNPFPFMGRTYICKSWADEKADDIKKISLPEPPETSFHKFLTNLFTENQLQGKTSNEIYAKLPEPVLLALAATSTDKEDLITLAEICCTFTLGSQGDTPVGIQYTKDADGRTRPGIHNVPLFEVLVNNRHLPDVYKEIMVLRPGVQGDSEIVGEWGKAAGDSHGYEYLRRNSYIPWGHYAANMAQDAIRYQIDDLTMKDMSGLRHLYYQRSFVQMAEELGLKLFHKRKTLLKEPLEELRQNIISALKSTTFQTLEFDSTLWGWNFGFDYTPNHYRLHASHQQIHQQYAFVPKKVDSFHDFKTQADANLPSYCCGDLVADFTSQYKENTGTNFFEKYIKAIRTNKRMDGRSDRESDLIIFEDDNIMLFVPKAQTSQWEIQLMTLKNVGNILEADTPTRNSLDRAILMAQKVLAQLGAKMVTSIEFSKRFTYKDTDQRLLYSFLPKLPQSMGAFSEAQLRFINGHYPEDFAAACRLKLDTIKQKGNFPKI